MTAVITYKAGDTIKEAKLVQGLQKRNTKALESIIVQYTPLVSAIVYNIIGNVMDTMDIEDVVSDVFLSIWDNAYKIEQSKLKSYLGCIARNKAKNKLRAYRPALSIEGNCIEIADEGFEHTLTKTEEASIVKRAVMSMDEPDCEIFLRYYYHYQTTAKIAEEMQLNCSTVQTKLKRGRNKLKDILLQGGYIYEN